MRAVITDRYGPADVQRIEETDRPAPADGEVLIRVYATTMNRTDCGFRDIKPFWGRLYTGLTRPRWRIFGSEVAGVVEEVGAGVTGFAVGDEVFGVNAGRYGTHAEYVCMRETAPLARKPEGASFAEAAAVCDGVVLAMLCLRHADLREGRTILVYGASGSIGTAAVQLAKHFGAEVTAVCGPDGVDLVSSLGADTVLDRSRDDFTRAGRAYDVIFDAVGKISFARAKGSLAGDGTYLAADGLWNLLLTLWTRRFGSRKVVVPIPPRYTKADVLLVKQLMEAGRYRAVIDRAYPLEQAVEAARYVESEKKLGNVVLTVYDGPAAQRGPAG